MSDFITYINVSDEVKAEINSFIDEWFSESTTIDVKTSGSTGAPTLLTLEKSNMIVSAKKTIDFLNLRPGDSALLCLSVKTIAGMMMIVRAIVGQLNLIVVSLSSNPLKEITLPLQFVAMVPLQLQNSLDNYPEKLRSIQSIIIGGGPISKSLEDTIRQKRIKLYHTFGMTETISHVAMRKIGDNEDSVFHALEGVSFSERDNLLEITFQEIGIDHLQTNDIVSLINSTSFEWKGRADFMINSGGIKVNPVELENALSPFLHVPYFIAGIEDSILGQKIVLLIESAVKLNLTTDFFDDKITKFAIPKNIFYLPSFIRTTSNKINRIETIKLLQLPCL